MIMGQYDADARMMMSGSQDDDDDAMMMSGSQDDDDARMQRWMLERCFRTLAMLTMTAPETITAARRKSR